MQKMILCVNDLQREKGRENSWQIVSITSERCFLPNSYVQESFLFSHNHLSIGIVRGISTWLTLGTHDHPVSQTLYVLEMKNSFPTLCTTQSYLTACISDFILFIFKSIVFTIYQLRRRTQFSKLVTNWITFSFTTFVCIKLSLVSMLIFYFFLNILPENRWM